MSTPDQLREQAKNIRRLAKYASGSVYYREMEEARAIEAKAKALELKIAADESRRKKLIAKVKIAQKQLGLDDDTYRDLLQNVTKKRSAAKLKTWELENVLKRMQQQGFKATRPKRAGTRKQAGDGQSRKIRSLWIQLHEAGKVHDSSENALVNWAKNSLNITDGVEALQWLDSHQKNRLIESLKGWLAR